MQSMIYPKNLEQKIGIDTVRQFITEKCLCTLGEEQVINMNFSMDYATISKWLEQTSEFSQIYATKKIFLLTSSVMSAIRYSE